MMFFFVFPVSRRASSAAGKETSMTDLESKAQTTPSAQTSPADVDKPEVDLNTSETNRFPNSYDVCGMTSFSFAGSRILCGLRLFHGQAMF